MFKSLFLFVFAFNAMNTVAGIPLLNKGVETNKTIDVNYMFVYHDRNVRIENLTKEVMSDIEHITDVRYIPQERVTYNMSNPLYIEFVNCSGIEINQKRRMYPNCFSRVIAEMINNNNNSSSEGNANFFHFRIYMDKIINYNNTRVKGLILHELLHMINKPHIDDSELDTMYPESLDNGQYGIATHELDLIGQSALIGIPNWYDIYGSLVGTKYIDDLRYRNLITVYFNYCRIMSKSMFPLTDRHIHCESVMNLMYGAEPRHMQMLKDIIDQLYDCVYVQKRVLQLCFARTLIRFNGDASIQHSVHSLNKKINTTEIAYISGGLDEDGDRRNIIEKLRVINNCRSANRTDCAF
jgi:hypothetical protein